LTHATRRDASVRCIEHHENSSRFETAFERIRNFFGEPFLQLRS
jgi:hypothetical protein